MNSSGINKVISGVVWIKIFLSAYPIVTGRKIGLSKAAGQPSMGGQIQDLMTDTRVSTVCILLNLSTRDSTAPLIQCPQVVRG